MDELRNPRSRLRSVFESSSYGPIQRIQYEFRNDTLVLTGVVPSYFLKQMAQSLATRTLGELNVENRIQVSGF